MSYSTKDKVLHQPCRPPLNLDGAWLVGLLQSHWGKSGAYTYIFLASKEGNETLTGF